MQEGIFNARANRNKFNLQKVISEEKVNDGYVVNVLCESCGFIQVAHNGKKVPWLDENKSR